MPAAAPAEPGAAGPVPDDVPPAPTGPSLVAETGSTGCARSCGTPASRAVLFIGAASQLSQGMFVVLFVVFVLDRLGGTTAGRSG